MLAGMAAVGTSEARPREKANTRDGIFETNVTNDLDIASGEPEIAIDPRNPRHLAIIEFALGSAWHRRRAGLLRPCAFLSRVPWGPVWAEVRRYELQSHHSQLHRSRSQYV